MDVLEEYHVPLHKVIGLCSDGASTMRGVYRGVCTRLQIKLTWKAKCLTGGDMLVLLIIINKKMFNRR
jgi:hypothetical protein